MTGDMFSHIFAESIAGQSYSRPLGIADVEWNGCCWSVKTVKNQDPHNVSTIRLISGRNSPIYSAGINDPTLDIQRTGQSVLDVYNARIAMARRDHDDLRLVVLVRAMGSQAFTLFERAIVPLAPNNYQWKRNNRKNLEGYEGDRHVFTWQPHGAQFTIIESVPSGAAKFRITKQVPILEMDHVLRIAKFEPDWVEIL